MACTTKLSITGSSSRICEQEPAASSHLNKGADVRLTAPAARSIAGHPGCRGCSSTPD